MLLVLGSAFAEPTPTAAGDFVSPSRDDAPLDGIVLYEANFWPEFVVTDSNGGTSTSEATQVTRWDLWWKVIAIHPRDVGWREGLTYEITPTTDDGSEFPSLTFTAGTASAPSPSAPEVGEVTVGEWSVNHRLVEVEVTLPNADPWAWVELVGEWEEPPSDGSGTEVHVDVAVGPGTHVVHIEQSRTEDGLPEPACFDLVAMSAAGGVGSATTACAEDADSNGKGCGCTSGPPSAVGWLVVPLLWRRRAYRRCARGPARSRTVGSS